MGNLGIRAKIRTAILVLGAGYVILLALVQWIASATTAHMKTASDSLFPAALSSQDAEAGFQKLSKRYSDAVLMQDKSMLTQADEIGQVVTASLDSVEQHTAFDPERQKEVTVLNERMRDLMSRSKSTYSTMIDSKENISAQTQAAVASVARENKEMEAALVDLQKKLSGRFPGAAGGGHRLI